MMKSKRLCFVCFCVLLLFSCNENLKKDTIVFDRTKLTADQKRLPENAVSALKVAGSVQVALFASEPMLSIGSRGLLFYFVSSA